MRKLPLLFFIPPPASHHRPPGRATHAVPRRPAPRSRMHLIQTLDLTLGRPLPLPPLRSCLYRRPQVHHAAHASVLSMKPLAQARKHRPSTQVRDTSRISPCRFHSTRFCGHARRSSPSCAQLRLALVAARFRRSIYPCSVLLVARRSPEAGYTDALKFTTRPTQALRTRNFLCKLANMARVHWYASSPEPPRVRFVPLDLLVIHVGPRRPALCDSIRMLSLTVERSTALAVRLLAARKPASPLGRRAAAAIHLSSKLVRCPARADT